MRRCAIASIPPCGWCLTSSSGRSSRIVRSPAFVGRSAPWAVRIEHVGSTAVPGLVAKPIVDLQVSVRSVSSIDGYVPALERHGYSYIRDDDSADYVLLVRPMQRPRSYHVHVCEYGCDHERRHLAVRDFLRASAGEARAYGELKQSLVARWPADRLAYMAGKHAYVAALEGRALTWVGGRSEPANGGRQSSTLPADESE
jgi:GrpB-like predicted nucleotidyltransferase (UPF0157 family)